MAKVILRLNQVGTMASSVMSEYERIRLRNMHDIHTFMYNHGLRKDPPGELAMPRIDTQVVEEPVKIQGKSGEDGGVTFKVPKMEETSSGRTLRPRKAVTYVEDLAPSADDYIYCDICDEDFFEGCSLHPAIRNEDKDLVMVKQSTIRGAGRGVFNNSTKAIPIGTLFGPYTGEIIKPAEYRKRQESGSESGYAWELMDNEKKRVVGYVDPGSDPDPVVDWLAIVNSANHVSQQNIIAVQVKGTIMYRVCRSIPPGGELLTYYGDEYAKAIRIDPQEYKHGKSKQFPCTKCGRSYTFEKDLKRHIKSAHDGVRWPCPQCGASFTDKSNLTKHIRSIHQGQKWPCSQCGVIFTLKTNLTAHIRSIHEGQNWPCPQCGVIFTKKNNLTRHIKSTHEGQQWPCLKCGMPFTRKGNLRAHMKTIHNLAEE